MSNDKVLTKNIVKQFLEDEDSAVDLGEFTAIEDAAAKSLSKYDGGNLNLNGLTSLSDAAAKSLSKYEGDLDLNGLTSLSDAAAESLGLNNHSESYLKFRRNCLFEGTILNSKQLRQFGSLDIEDLYQDRGPWHSIRDDLDYDSFAITGETFDSVEDLLANGVAELEHLDADGEPRPLHGEPVLDDTDDIERRSRSWTEVAEALAKSNTDSDTALVAWRISIFPKGYYSYRIPMPLSNMNLAEIELKMAYGWGGAEPYVTSVHFRGTQCVLAHCEDGSGYGDGYALQVWNRNDGLWEPTDIIDDIDTD